MNILIYAGFYKSNNGERLLFNYNKINELKQIKQILTSFNVNDSIQNITNEIVNAGFTMEEAQKAIKMSKQQNDDYKQSLQNV